MATRPQATDETFRGDVEGTTVRANLARENDKTLRRKGPKPQEEEGVEELENQQPLSYTSAARRGTDRGEILARRGPLPTKIKSVAKKAVFRSLITPLGIVYTIQLFIAVLGLVMLGIAYAVSSSFFGPLVNFLSGAIAGFNAKDMVMLFIMLNFVIALLIYIFCSIALYIIHENVSSEPWKMVLGVLAIALSTVPGLNFFPWMIMWLYLMTRATK